jgi:hypothetical protein
MKKLFLPIITILAVAALSVSAYPPPEKDDMTLTELEKRIFEFDGKVVEVEITYAYDIEPKSPGNFSVWCSYDEGGRWDGSGRTIYFSNDKDGKVLEFFEELVASRWSGGRKSLYVLVEGKTLTAIGEKYKKSKGSYSW